jgi:hypothetical protein
LGHWLGEAHIVTEGPGEGDALIEPTHRGAGLASGCKRQCFELGRRLIVCSEVSAARTLRATKLRILSFVNCTWRSLPFVPVLRSRSREAVLTLLFVAECPSRLTRQFGSRGVNMTGCNCTRHPAASPVSTSTLVRRRPSRRLGQPLARTTST